MPRPIILRREYDRYAQSAAKRLALAGAVGNVRVQYAPLFAEIIFLRSFSVFEESVRTVTLKIVCGAGYVDGSAPLLVAPRASLATAEAFLMTHGRTKRRKSLKWTNAAYIEDNVNFSIDPAD